MGTSIDKLNYMSTTKTKIKDAINLTNVNITTDTFRSYETKFKQGIINTLNNPDAVWSNFTKVTGTGESLTLTPTEHAPMVLTLKGQTSQASTPTPSTPQAINVVSGEQDINVCGKNLFNYNLPLINDYITTHGITYTIDNGVYTCNGTNQTTYQFIEYDFVLQAGTYIASGCASGGSQNGYSSLLQANGTNYWDTGSGVTFTLDSATMIKYYPIRIGSQTVTMNNLQFKPMIRLSNTSSEYEAYKGNTYEINLGLKNLFDISTSQSYKWLTYQGAIQNSSDPNIVSAFIKVENGKQYIFSGIPTGTYSVRVCSYTGTTTNTFKTLLINNNSNIRTFTADADYIVFAIGQADATALTNIQLTIDDNPIELCKIGTYQDYVIKSTGKNLYPNVIEYENKVLANNGAINNADNFVISYEIEIDNTKNYYLSWTIGTLSDKAMRVGYYDSTHTFISRPFSETTPYNLVVPNNAKYIRLSYAVQNFSNIQLEEGQATSYEPYGTGWYLHKEIGKYTFTGNETISLQNNGKRIYVNSTASSIPEPLHTTSISQTFGMYCNKLVEVTAGQTWGATQGISYDYNSGENTGNFDISINGVSTLADYRTAIAGIIVYYILQTPTDTPIEDSELLEQLNSIKSCDGVTNISQNSSYEVSILDAIAIKQIGVN